jgi:hypothetical protein
LAETLKPKLAKVRHPLSTVRVIFLNKTAVDETKALWEMEVRETAAAVNTNQA